MKTCFKNLKECSYYPIEEKPSTAFVLMPFDKSFDEVYSNGIKNGLPNGWIFNRADEIFIPPENVCKICKSIQEATLIIVDVTDRNPNVFLELGLSFGLEKNILLITQNISDLPFDIKTFDTIEYSLVNITELSKNIEDRIKVLPLSARFTYEAIAFYDNIENNRWEGSIKGPTMQVFIGSKNSRDVWLENTQENLNLLGCAPKFLYKSIKVRNVYFEFEPRSEDKYLKVFTDGFIVARFPCVTSDNERKVAYIHELMYYIGELFVFANRIMKNRTIKHHQRIRVEIYAIQGFLVQFDSGRGWFGEVYDFAKDGGIIEIEEDFNPSDEWQDLVKVLGKIYQKICNYSGIPNIDSKTLKDHIRTVLGRMRELRTRYSNSGIDIFPFDSAFS